MRLLYNWNSEYMNCIKNILNNLESNVPTLSVHFIMLCNSINTFLKSNILSIDNVIVFYLMPIF